MTDASTTNRTKALAERVSREKVAHDETDVLAESHRLKDKFGLVFSAPHIQRLDRTWEESFVDVRGLTILDYGCGRGELGLDLCRRGATVRGLDISESYVGEANREARIQGLSEQRAFFEAGDAHVMKYPDQYFDLVVGFGILHHLDMNCAFAEIFRVLKPGGAALFKEPLIGPPWMRIFRALTPKARTVDERPLDEATLRKLDRMFHVRSSYYGLFLPGLAASLSIVAPRGNFTGLFGLVDRVDQALGRAKLTRSWHQYVMLRLERPVTP